MYNMTIANTCCMIYRNAVKRVNPKSSHHKKIFLLFPFFLYMRRWMLAEPGTHVRIYVSQIIMLYTLNFYTDICQLFLNKTRKNNNNKYCY